MPPADPLRLSDPAPVYLLWGDDHARRKAARLKLRQAVLDLAPGMEAFHHERFEAPYVEDVDTVIAACRQAPLGAGKRLVELDQPDALGAQVRAKERAKGELDPLLAYIKEPVPSCVLVLVSPSLAGTSRLVKAAKASDHTVELRYAVASAKDAASELMHHAKAQGWRLGRGVASAIVDRVGAARAAWQDALALLAAQAGGQTIELTHVEALVVRTQTGDIFALTDAVGRRDAATALALLGPYFAAGEKTVESAMKLNAMLAWQLRRLMMVAAQPNPRALAELGLKSFVQQKLSEQARRFTWPQLVQLHAGLVQMDRDLKGGSPLGYDSPMLLLQRWILEACGALPGARPRTQLPR